MMRSYSSWYDALVRATPVGGAVPLSEHEQRLLEQIEQSLYAEDPKFARSWRAKDLSSLKRLRYVRAAVGLVVGIVLLLAGVITLPAHTPVGIGLGVGGFLLMLASGWYAFANRSRTRPGGDPTARSRAKGRSRGPKRSLVARLEERWERRQDGRGFGG
jgi:hypothetical protein